MTSQPAESIVDFLTLPVRDFVSRSVLILLGRAPSPSEQKVWESALRLGRDRIPLLAEIYDSREAQRYRREEREQGSDEEFVERLYQRYLERSPEPEGLATYTEQLKRTSRAAIEADIAASEEAIGKRSLLHEVGPVVKDHRRERQWWRLLSHSQRKHRMRNLEFQVIAATRISTEINSATSSFTSDLVQRCGKLERGLDELRQDMASEQRFGQMQQAIRDLRENVDTSVASQMGGLRKDSYAVAQRIAGLEEERGMLLDRVASVMKEFHSTADSFDRRYGKLERAVDEMRQEMLSEQRFGELEQQLRDLRQHVTPSSDYKGLIVAPGLRGSRFLVRQHDLIGKHIAGGSEWEPHVREAIEAAANPDGIAIDAGAYIGIHTVTMSRCFSAVHAFEPQKGIFQILGGNLALNERLNVTTYNLALYDHGVAMRLAPQERQEIEVPILNGQPRYQQLSNAAALSFEIAAGGEEQVRAIALDELGLDNVKFMKIDTQGSDLHVLKGARQTINRSQPIITFEWERDLAAFHGTKLEDIHVFFDAINYEVEVLHETTPDRQIDYIAKPRSIA